MKKAGKIDLDKQALSELACEDAIISDKQRFGRVYEISFTADDGNGGSCTGSVTVGVPHDKKDTPENSGTIYDSTVE